MNPSTSFLYWYRRYKVRAQDMTTFQEAMSELARGLGEGAFGSAVLTGLDVVPLGGLVLGVSGGIACGASGYLMSVTGNASVTGVAPTGGLPSRNLVVISPLTVDSNLIQSPTAPGTNVPLYQLQQCVVKIIAGTPGQNPAYPSKGQYDTILCGFRLPSGAATVAPEDYDFTVREIPGVSTKIRQFTLSQDDRLRPYRSSATTLGIKPAQTFGNNGPLMFTYPGRGQPSLYPVSSGVMSKSDALLNFATGAISGGDTSSAAFTPTIPTGANSVVATVWLDVTDKINVSYGTQGTKAQCLAAIKNQTADGSAGAINAQKSQYKVSYVIVTSVGGAFSEIDVIDARPLGGGGAGGAGGQWVDLYGVDSGQAAVETRFGFSKVLAFTPGLQQRASGLIKIPTGYNLGAPINLKLDGLQSATGSVNKYIGVSGILYRKGTDVVASIVNLTAATATFGAGAVSNILTEVVVGLTDVLGKVNGVSVNPGDEIEILMQEVGNSQGTDDLMIRQQASEVTFS